MNALTQAVRTIHPGHNAAPAFSLLSPDDLPGKAALNSRLAAVFHRQADLAALGCAGEQWTYRQLVSRAAHIARQLTERGIGAGDRVGLYLTRSADLLAAVLACVRAGVCFVLLEPEFSLSKLQTIALQADLRLVLMAVPLHGAFAMPVHCLEPGLLCNEDWPVQDDQLPAYMMFTADSSGQFEGALVSRRALAVFLRSATGRIGASAGTRWLFAATLAFDAALLEMLAPLWVGGYVEIVPSPVHLDPVELVALLRKRPDINTLQATPAFWQQLLKAGWRGHRGLLALCDGGGLDATLVGRLENCVGQLWDCQGPTEATNWSMMRRVRFPMTGRGIGYRPGA